MTERHDEREQAAAKLWSMIKDIRIAMMTTWDGEEMHARPMYGHLPRSAPPPSRSPRPD